jgi:PAS domain S-box-containing protein
MAKPRDPIPGLESDPALKRGHGPAEFLSGHLLAGASWDDRMDAALEALGHLARADRVLLVSDEGAPPGVVVRIWPVTAAGRATVDDPRFRGEVIGSQLEALEAGKPVRIEPGDARVPGDEVVRRERAPWILALPIQTASGWWGYVVIERLTGSGWGDADIQRLLDASRILGWGVERWTAEIRLREELERTRPLLEASPGVGYVHTDGEPKTILSMSPRIEEVLGYPADAWLRDPGFAWGLLHPDDRSRIEALDSLGAPPVLEYRMFARDGRLVWLCDATAPARDPNGGVIHRGILIDVTSLREADEAIAAASAKEMRTASARIRAALLARPDPQLSPDAVRLAQDASQYMREHLAEGLDLPSVSRVLAISPGYLGRVFKRYMGTTPHQFLIDLRLEAAEDLLRETDLTVSQIAWRVGFASPSHFVTTFRARTGTTPLTFRRRAR